MRTFLLGALVAVVVVSMSGHGLQSASGQRLAA
jgi:hypothetical protein